MDRTEMMLRLGYYSGVASRDLGDTSYAIRFLGRAEEVTEEIYLEASLEIQQRLVAAGLIGPDEDPYESIRLQR